MKDKLSRRTVLAGAALSVAAASAQAAAAPSVVKANGEALQSILDRQVTDPDRRWTGGPCQTAGEYTIPVR